MDEEVVFLGAIALISFAYCIVNIVSYLLYKDFIQDNKSADRENEKFKVGDYNIYCGWKKIYFKKADTGSYDSRCWQ